MVTRVHGHFANFTGKAHIDLVNSSRSRVEVDIEAGSVTTNNRQRDAHLRTGDFFDVPRHPHITYSSTEVSRVGDSMFKVVGDLTIRGVSNSLLLEFHYHGATTDAEGNIRLAAHASTVISRLDWGLSWSGAVEVGGIVVADKVTLEIDVSARRVSKPETRAETRVAAVAP